MVQRKDSPRRWAKRLVRSAVVVPVAAGALTFPASGVNATTTEGERSSSAVSTTTVALGDDSELNEDWMPVHGSE